MAAGYKVDIHNNSSGNISVTRATGGDTINGAAKAITLPAQQHMALRVNAAANGYLIEGNTGGLFLDPTDPSKQLKFDLSGITTGTVRTLTLPDSNFTLTTPGLALLNSGAASGATLDIVMTAYTAYAHKLLVFDLIPTNDAVSLILRVSTDGGGTYNSSANDYSDEMQLVDDSAGTAAQNRAAGAGATFIYISFATNIGNGATEGISGQLFMPNTTSTAKWPRFSVKANAISADATPRFVEYSGGGTRRAAQDTDAIRILFDTNTIASGTWKLYGYN